MNQIRYTYKSYMYLRISDLPPDERAAILPWFSAQTAPLIPGLKPQDAIFLHDYERGRRDASTGDLSEWD